MCKQVLSGAFGELDRDPLIIIRKVHMFRYWFKILNLNEQSPVKQMYLLLKNDTNRNLSYNRLNWAFQIKGMLDQLGFSELWINQDNILTIRLNTIKQRLLDHYYQSWYSNINNSRRLNTYCIFKHTFNLEPYLDIITNKRFRIALSRFRLSSHKF